MSLHWVQRPGQRVKTVLRPGTLDQALGMLAEDPVRRPVAGGTDLLLDLQRSPATTPVSLIDLSGVESFSHITATSSGRFVIGGGATHNDVIAHAGLMQHALPLAQACLEVGSPQLRNRATIAGNLATASPANDTISALMVLDAEVLLASMANGAYANRRVPVTKFFTGLRSTVIEPGELIEAIVVPSLAPSARGIWAKLGLRKAQAISVVHGGVVVDLAGGDMVTEARVSLGSVAATVVRVPQVEELLTGSALTPSLIEQAAELAAASVEPIDDGRATAAYRTNGVRVLVSRCLTTLAADGQASRWPERRARLAGRDVVIEDGRRAAASPRRTILDDNSEINVTVNGAEVAGTSAASATLLDWVRDNASLGTKEGCAEGECGACTVMLDGAAVMSCLVPAAQADGATITTVEGLASAGSGDLTDLQQQFVDSFAVQCGYCIPGFLMASTALVDELPNPTRDEIEFALAGNLCRCTGYYPIVTAVEKTAQLRSSRTASRP